ncbi:putative hyoscyamine (6S)-dioxygenase [Medicago truncatula]|uniref:Putative hyoscyamine (6S)-dioxygenase n=1 Tax=Medicago truncatula TaxID=3880 RepID=A0A396GTW0_MEDTR|nr:putative hyoscyamine (6S)-dioxygenase [Medicago truncatula]
MDGKLVSSWYNLHSSVPQSYVQPPERQPCNAVHVLSTNQKVPVIDLGGHDRDDIIRNIIKASEEYGFFQVVNHGVAKELMDDTYKIFKEFHAMLANEKVRESSKDPNGSCKLYTSCGGNINDVAKYWKDSLEHRCPPSGEFTWYWPEKPDGYRCGWNLGCVLAELQLLLLCCHVQLGVVGFGSWAGSCCSCAAVCRCVLGMAGLGSLRHLSLWGLGFLCLDPFSVFCSGSVLLLLGQCSLGFSGVRQGEIVGRYTQELRALALRILDLISEGLELNPNYFTGELSDSPVVISHHYPPCPEPSLTLGAPQHKDPNILTILFQQPEITALQILKDGAWIPIEPIPNAFVVNMGFML